MFEGEAGTIGLVCLGAFNPFLAPEVKVDALEDEEADGTDGFSSVKVDPITFDTTKQGRRY